MNNVLEINGLTKNYKKVRAVNNLNLEIKKGEVFGFLGPNGSGKTTTLGMILGVTLPSSGTFSWFGEGDADHLRLKIGSILEKPNFYPSLSGYKNLQISCKIKGVDELRIDQVLDQVSLLERKDHSFKTYSLGMKQRLAIAAALLNDPEVLIFDEPTNGLDPQGIAEIRTLITTIAEGGKTIILASHLLDEVQKVCSSFIVLKNGNLVHQGNVEGEFSDHHLVEVASADMISLEKTLGNYKHLSSLEKRKDKYILKIDKTSDIEELSRFLSDNKVYLSHFSVVKRKLEDQFIEILAQNK
ncbi:MAG: ABC-type multidrug transport system ATPase subunit [Patiriisocius sp.]|jgi:ABC-type multidrug transport system ATPase subunit